MGIIYYDYMKEAFCRTNDFDFSIGADSVKVKKQQENGATDNFVSASVY